MKRLIAFLLLFIPFASFADDIASMHVNDVIAIFDEELPLIENRIAKLNPDLAKRMANVDKYDKIYEYNNFLVHHIFDEKIQYYIDMLYQHCEQTGCKVNHVTYSDGAYGYEVEQKDPSMKRPECYKNGDTQNDRICPYPSNYDFSWFDGSQNHFNGIIDDLNRAHFYEVAIDDRDGHFYLILYDNDNSHNMLLEYNNQAIICNSEEQPYVRAYKDCVANSQYQDRCDDITLENWVFSEHDKCLEKYRPSFDIKINGGIIKGFKNW